MGLWLPKPKKSAIQSTGGGKPHTHACTKRATLARRGEKTGQEAEASRGTSEEFKGRAPLRAWQRSGSRLRLPCARGTKEKGTISPIEEKEKNKRRSGRPM